MQSLEVLTAVKDFLACAQRAFAALQTPPRVPRQQLSPSSQVFLAAWKSRFLGENAPWVQRFAEIYSHSHSGAPQLPPAPPRVFQGFVFGVWLLASSTKKGRICTCVGLNVPALPAGRALSGLLFSEICEFCGAGFFPRLGGFSWLRGTLQLFSCSTGRQETGSCFQGVCSGAGTMLFYNEN